MKTGIIMLAAGSSSRMGQSKQLLSVYDKPLLRHMAEVAVSLNTAATVVVLGDRADAHREVLRSLPVEIVENSAWVNGMGSSLKTGLNHLLSVHPDIFSCMILVCDQPHVSAPYLVTLQERHQQTGKLIAASFYAKSPGVPAIFSQKLFPALLTLDDAHGAKKVIEKNLSETESVPFPQGAIDLDTMNDYQKFIDNN